MYKKLTELSEGEYKQLCDDHTRLYETLTITEMKLGELQYNLKHIKANQKKIFMKILGVYLINGLLYIGKKPNMDINDIFYIGNRQ